MKNFLARFMKEKNIISRAIKPFTSAQKTAIYNHNIKHNDGYLRSDKDGLVLKLFSGQ